MRSGRHVVLLLARDSKRSACGLWLAGSAASPPSAALPEALVLWRRPPIANFLSNVKSVTRGLVVAGRNASDCIHPQCWTRDQLPELVLERGGRLPACGRCFGSRKASDEGHGDKPLSDQLWEVRESHWIHPRQYIQHVYQACDASKPTRPASDPSVVVGNNFPRWSCHRAAGSNQLFL